MLDGSINSKIRNSVFGSSKTSKN